MVTHRGGRVTESVVRRDDRRAFGQVRFKGPLEHVSGIDQQHRAAVTRAGFAQILHVAAKQREPTAAVSGKDPAMKIVGADD